MKSAFIQTKEKAEDSVSVPESSAEEYASNRLESGIDRVSHEAVHQFDKQGRKGVQATKQNIPYTNLTSRGARAFRRQSRISSRQRTVFKNSRRNGRRSRFKNRRRVLSETKE